MKAMLMSMLVMAMAVVGGGDKDEEQRVKVIKRAGDAVTTIIMEREEGEPATLNINGSDLEINLDELAIGETRVFDLEDGEQAEITRDESGFSLLTGDEPIRLMYVDGDLELDHDGEFGEGDHVVFVDGDDVFVNGQDIAKTVQIHVSKALETLHESKHAMVFHGEDGVKVELKGLEGMDALDMELDGLDEAIEAKIEAAMAKLEDIEHNVDVQFVEDGEAEFVWTDENGETHTGTKKKFKFISVDTQEFKDENGKTRKKIIIKHPKQDEALHEDH